MTILELTKRLERRPMATIKDVAKLAGVSASTASRALHDNDMISQATKERVRKAMKELNYSPNYSAQNLVKRRSNTIGVVLPVRESQESLGNNPFFMQIIQGISGVCTDNHYMVSLATGRTEEELIANIETLIRSGNIAKFIFLYSKANDKVFQFVQQAEVSCVVVGESYNAAQKGIQFVDNDNTLAGQDAAQFLVDKGYREIAYAYTDMDELVQASRYMGYANVMKEEGQKTKRLQLSRIDDSANLTVLSAFLEKNPRLEAFVACDDIMAIRLQRLFKKLDLPSDNFAMISFNNSIVSEIATPALTSIDIFPYQLGSKAAELILGKAEGENFLTIPHQIIERDSTWPNRKK